MSSDHDVIDVEFSEVRERAPLRLIWADRLALVIGILLSAIAALYAYGGIEFRLETTNEVFVTCLKIAWGIAIAIWLLGRAVDFLFTGRVRH